MNSIPPLLKLLLSLFTAMLLTVSSTAWCSIKKPSTPNRIENDPAFITATVLRPGSPLAEFSLQDTNNKPFNLQSLKGHWTLMYFGYADCPDICPRSLLQISEIYQIFAKQEFKHQPRFIFASLNSSTDTVEKLKEFLGRFNSGFMGLTGSEAEMSKLTASCRVHSWTDPKPNANGQKVIDHSAAILLINPHGQLQALFSPPLKPMDIASDIQKLLNS